MALYSAAIAVVMAALFSVYLAIAPIKPSYLAFQQPSVELMADNFLTYRDAVENYVETHPTFSGSIPFATLEASGFLPVGYTALANWQNTTIGNQVMAWGPVPVGASFYLARDSSYCYDVGVASAGDVGSGGNVYSAALGVIQKGDVPSYVPDGYAVSIIGFRAP